MKEGFLLPSHLLITIVRALGPGGVRAVVAENLLLEHQLLVIVRSRRRAPNFVTRDRFVLGFLRFHQYLVRRKYRMLFSPRKRSKPRPKGPSKQLIRAVVEIKRRNPDFGCPKMALIVTKKFGVEIDKNVVGRILASHYHHHQPGCGGPSWLTFIGHTKDSLWSVDLFRCEPITLNSHWGLVIMGQFARRIIGFAAHAGNVDSMVLCQMFNEIIAGYLPPKYMSTDNDSLIMYHRWQANLRILDVDEIKSIWDGSPRVS